MAKPISKQIREAILAGEEISSQIAQERWGAHPSALKSAMRTLNIPPNKQLVKRRDKKFVYFSVQLKEPDTSQKIFPESAPEPEPMILPALLDQLEVSAIAVDRKGKLGMTLRNSKHSWRVIIEGVASK